MGRKIARYDDQSTPGFQQREELGPDIIGMLLLGAGMCDGQAGVTEVIEGDQRQSVRALEFSDRLPINLGCDKSVYEMLGFEFGKPLDNLFQEARMPSGWTKKGDGGYWTTFVDASGAERGTMFYKSAFYDRDAFCNLSPRYSVDRQDLDYGTPDERISACVKDRLTNTVIFETETKWKRDFGIDENDRSEEMRQKKLAWYDLRDQLCAEAGEWLRDRFPDPHVAAYWPESEGKLPCRFLTKEQWEDPTTTGEQRAIHLEAIAEPLNHDAQKILHGLAAAWRRDLPMPADLAGIRSKSTLLKQRETVIAAVSKAEEAQAATEDSGPEHFDLRVAIGDKPKKKRKK